LKWLLLVVYMYQMIFEKDIGCRWRDGCIVAGICGVVGIVDIGGQLCLVGVKEEISRLGVVCGCELNMVVFIGIICGRGVDEE
jgi:hypothetical protein